MRTDRECVALALEHELGEVASPENRHVVVGRIRLHFLDWGNATAPCVVLLHGGGLNAHTRDRVCLALSSRYRFLSVDLRGHGDSEWSPEADYSLDAHRRDLEGFVDELALSRFALVGHSFGAFIGLHYAARHSEVVRGGCSLAVSAEEAADFAALVALGRTVVVEDARHNVQADNPAGLVPVLYSFLADCK